MTNAGSRLSANNRSRTWIFGALDVAASMHQVKWHWVKGHAGHDGNERCDQLCSEAMAAIKKQYTQDQLANALTAFKNAVNVVSSSSMLF